MAKAKVERRTHSDAFKTKAVGRLLAGRIGVGEFSDEHDLAHSMVRRWARDPRFGGKAGAFTRGANGANGAGFAGLPTRKKNGGARAQIAKVAVPIVYSCPHCGGPIKVSEASA